MQNTGFRRRRRLPQLRTFFCLFVVYIRFQFNILWDFRGSRFKCFFHDVREVMTANVRFVFVCFGKRFSRGVPFVRSFVYSLDFLLFLTAGRRHGLLLPAMLNNVPVCFIILLFASSRRVLLVFSYIFTLLFLFCLENNGGVQQIRVDLWLNHCEEWG